MTVPRDADALIRAFLAEGQTELPDRAFDAVRREIHGTRQRVVVRPSGMPQRSSVVRIAIATAAVVAVTFVAITLRNQGFSGPGAPSPSPRPSPTPSAPPSPSPSSPAYTWPAQLAPGTYATNLVWSPDLVFRFAVPEGWQSRDIEIIKNDRMALQFYRIENLVADTCGEKVAVPPVGKTPTAIATGLSKLVSLEAGPSAVSVGGRSGTYIEYTVGPNLGCAPADFRLIKLASSSCGKGCGGLGPPYKGIEFSAPVEHNRLWILTYGRSHVVMNALWTPDAKAVDLAELQAVIDSAWVDTPNATPQPVQEPLPSGP